MRISDWSSDVCSSDLHQFAAASALAEPISNNPWPVGSSTKMNGTRNAGIVYFQHCMVVLYGSPPVIADAANGDKAVGGDTSDRSAERRVGKECVSTCRSRWSP